MAGDALTGKRLVGLCGTMAWLGDWRSGSALPSHGRGHWFDPSIAHQIRLIARLFPNLSVVVVFFSYTPGYFGYRLEGLGLLPGAFGI